MNICGIDFETTGLDPKKDRITEIGAIVWDENYKELAVFETMVYEPTYPHITDIVTKITGITDKMLTSGGAIPPRLAFEKLAQAVAPHNVEYIVAHNAPFDRAFFVAECALQFGPQDNQKKVPWLDSQRDIVYPEHLKCRKLSHLALDHGIMVDPKTLHRSLGDIRVMGELLKYYKISDMIARSNEDWVTLRAAIPGPWVGNGGDGGVGKKAISQLGFTYQSPRHRAEVYPKQWVIRVKESEVAQINKSMQYSITELKREKNENC